MTSESSKLTDISFQLIVDSVPNAIVLANKEGKMAYVNSQTEKLFGYKRIELIGQNVEILIPERFKKKHPTYLKMFFENPSVREMGAGRELYALRKDGSEFPIEIGLNPLILVGGTLVLASIIDISERKKAEERFSLVVNSAPNAMILVNQKGVITLVNNEAKKLFGYEENQLINQKLEMLIPERFRGGHIKFRDSFFKKPQARPMGAGRDLFGVRKDGKEIPIEIGLNPIETNDGLMVLASIIDITERKIREEAVARKKELEIKNKELEQFTYLASHDLQEPLRTVSNFSEALKEDYGDKFDETGQRFLNSIYRASERMRILVRSLLEYSRLGRDKMKVFTDLNKIIRDIKNDLSSTIKNSEAEIHVGHMPHLKVYETEIRQLFQNLINNAIKFSKKDVPPVIHISSEKMSDKWKFSIADNGIGIDSKYFKRIFEIFQRLHKADVYEGYGVGLPNCKKIVELHGGEIWVESEPGKGSTFHFTISTFNYD